MLLSPRSSRPEVLAPAGDADALRAAVRAGADAVYFGLSSFNARARATNFDETALGEAMRFLHENGRRGYVTLNTLVFDEELGALERAIRACAAAGVDAVIVQDLGVARLVREVAPTMPIHASTQMTCTDAASVELARELGASRVILARELSLEDIAAIRKETDVELEVFVHGALCVAYSGQCLTSEAIGGRSANRGACAQACRLPYELIVDGAVHPTGDRAFLLSPEDLEASALVPRLVELGVSSLKIEGRLKAPEYVAATTRLYREAIDAVALGSEPPTEEERKRALQMFSRGSGPGFLAGVDHQRLVEGRACDHRGLAIGAALGTRHAGGKAWIAVRLTEALSRGDGVLVEGGFGGEGEVGGRVWSLRRGNADVERGHAGDEVLVWLGPDKAPGAVTPGARLFKTNDPAAEKAVRASFEREPEKRPVHLRIRGAFGEPAVLEARTDDGRRAEVVVDGHVEPATRTPLTREVLVDKLGRLGDSPFVLGSLESDLPDGALVPLSALNRARRAVVDALLVGSHRAHATTEASAETLLAALPTLPPPTAPAGLFVLCRTLEQAFAAAQAGASGILLDFLELTGTGAAVRALRERTNVPLTAAPPRIRKPGEEKIERYLEGLAPDAILVRSLGALRSGAGSTIPRIADFSLNVTNSVTALEVLRRGVQAFTPSFDLDASQLRALLSGRLAPYAEVVLHHPMPLFHMEHCVFAALLSDGKDYRTCGRPCEHHKVSLRDRAGMEHPVEADVGCRNTVFHAAAQSAAGLVPALQEAGVRRFRIELVRESADETRRVVELYRRLLGGSLAPGAVMAALKTEGRYGVVRGSLRVLSAGA